MLHLQYWKSFRCNSERRLILLHLPPYERIVSGVAWTDLHVLRNLILHVLISLGCKIRKHSFYSWQLVLYVRVHPSIPNLEDGHDNLFTLKKTTQLLNFPLWGQKILICWNKSSSQAFTGGYEVISLTLFTLSAGCTKNPGGLAPFFSINISIMHIAL